MVVLGEVPVDRGLEVDQRMPGSYSSLVRRLLKNVASDEVTHLSMSFASICALALQAKRNSTRSIDYVVSFQGDEEFASHARKAGLWKEYRRGLKEIMEASRSPGIVVTYDYRDRISEAMGIDAGSLEVIYNGVECQKALTKPSIEILQSVFPDLDQDRPVVSYIGRQESENGIDLLLYAAKILEVRSRAVQLVICGSTVSDIASHLRIPIHHARAISVAVRNAPYMYSYCVVYPSINREPFGLVVAGGVVAA